MATKTSSKKTTKAAQSKPVQVPELDQVQDQQSDIVNGPEYLREKTCAVRVSFSWLGTTRALDKTTRTELAATFEADGDRISAGKKLLDRSHEKFARVTSLRNDIKRYWQENSLPFPEPGMRLIKKDSIQSFEAQMRDFKEALEAAVAELEEVYPDLMKQAEEDLGRLFNASDYPATLIGAFQVHWDFPSIEAPKYLMELHPDIYERERKRVAATFEEAARLAEAAFLGEFAGLVSHLCAMLTERNAEGEYKTFKDSVINNLTEFFGKFRSLSFRSNPELDTLIAQAQEALSGKHVSAKSIRVQDSIREDVAKAMSAVKEKLDMMAIPQPRRKVDRKLARKPEPVAAAESNGKEII